MFATTDFLLLIGEETRRHTDERRCFQSIIDTSDVWLGVEPNSDWRFSGDDQQNWKLLTGLFVDGDGWGCDTTGVKCDNGEITVIRDRLGRVPVVGSFGASGWASSKINLFGTKPHESAIQTYLSQGKDDTHVDFYAGQIRLRPGEKWSQSGGFEHYWMRQHHNLDFAECTARVRGILASYCEPGSLIMGSGGLDSSVLFGLTQSPRLCTMGFRGFPESDESEWSQLLASTRNAEHFLLDLSSMVDSEIASGPTSLENPQFHPNEFVEATFLRASAAWGNTQRILCGVGADQLFSMPNHFAWQGLVQEGESWRIFDSALDTKPMLKAIIRVIAGAGLSRHEISDYHRRLTQSWDWEHIVRHVRRVQRASGVGLVLPFLDWRLWDIMNDVPVSWLYYKGPKGLLKAAGAEDLDPIFLNRPKDTLLGTVAYGVVFGGRPNKQVGRSFRDSALRTFGFVDEDGVDYADEVVRECEAGNQSLLTKAWVHISTERWLQKMEELETSVEETDYEPPALEYLGELGEVVRGAASDVYDTASQGCATSGGPFADPPFGC